MKLKPIARAVALVGAVLLGSELVYVVVANSVIYSGLIQWAAATSPDRVELGWERAYSAWPGRAHVSGFRLAVQDRVMQLRLTIDEASLDVTLWELFRKRFRASHVHAEGVSFRFLPRSERTPGQAARLAAFPTIEGFPRPAWVPDPALPPMTPEQIDMLWNVQLDDVEGTLSELWILEYRYQGPAHVSGGFALSPLRTLWVGPARLDLEGGTLSAGEHTLSSAFTLAAQVTIAPVDLPSSPGFRVLQTLTASVHCDTALEDLGAADLYLDGLRMRGSGKLAVALQIATGRLMPGSTLAVWLPATAVELRGQSFSGKAQASLSVSEDTKVPTVLAALNGGLSVRLPSMKALETSLSGVTLEAALADNDLSSGPSLQRLFAVVGEARVNDARPITGTLSLTVPVFAQLVLGEGPLIASATAYVTPQYSLVRLKSLTLGDGALEGAAVPGANGWNGAAAGHFGRIRVGLRLHDSALEGALFVLPTWLSTELRAAGIVPEKEPPMPQATAE